MVGFVIILVQTTKGLSFICSVTPVKEQVSVDPHFMLSFASEINIRVSERRYAAYNFKVCLNIYVDHMRSTRIKAMASS